MTQGPWFENHVRTLASEGRDVVLRAERAVADDDGVALLESILERQL